MTNPFESPIIDNQLAGTDNDEIESNTCDKCREAVHPLDLIWLTAEDFQPLEDEELTEEAKKYDAVCHNCYGDIITLKAAQ